MRMRIFARPLAVVLVAFSPAMLGQARAQSTQSTPCVTQSECDLREDQRDTRARRDQWNANAKYQEEASAERRRLGAQAQARAESGRLSRVQEVMRRRREAAARTGH